MGWYKILAPILLMLSVIDFALAAPVVVQEHQVSPPRPDPWPANAADRTNVPPISRSSDSGHWREQEPRQHNLKSRTDLHQQSGRKITDISGPAGNAYRFLRVMKPYMVTPETGGRL
jgi:hypothetical protein